MPRCPVPVFVLGCGRSGTTVTARLLNHLPGVHIAKETGYLNQHLDLLKQIREAIVPAALLQVVNSWMQTNDWTGRASAEGFADFCRRQGMSGPAAFIHYVWSLDCPEPFEQLQFIGDNTPLYALSIPELKQLLPTARFIHVVRDPRDVVCSTLKMRFGAFDATVAAMEWHLTIGAWLMAERWLPVQDRLEFRYEDLCISPENTFGRVAGFLGFNTEEVRKALAEHAAGGRKGQTGFEAVAAQPHHTRIAEPLSPSRVGRYKQELTADQLQAVEEQTCGGMLACGYQPEQMRLHPLAREDRPLLLKALLRDLWGRCRNRLKRNPRNTSKRRPQNS
ncbi:MAG: hypothetical protein RIT02_873 [Planctomycetota bacterium]|jgi:Sulfotransferase family